MKKMIRTQAGRFFAGLIALLLAACIMVGVEQLPFLKTDITAQQLMTPDAQVKDIIGSVEKDVDICYLASDGNVDIWLEELASKYAGMNSKITYRRLAPTADGASAIAAKAGVVSAENLVIITSGDRSVAISGDEMYNIQYDEMAYYYYGEMVVKSQAYAADDRLVNGILYVTDDELPVVYALKGHGETAVTGALQAYLKDFNVRVADLSLNNAEMPGDAAVLLIHMPTSDLTDDETEKILSYLKDGGKLLLTTNYMTGDLPNLETVTAYYGMDAVAGVVLESDAKYCYSAELPYYLIPDAQQHEINAMLNETGAKGLLSLSCARTAGTNIAA